MTKLAEWFARAWQQLRRLSGDDAYERYLEHYYAAHRNGPEPLDRATFYRTEIDRRWTGIKRCC